MELELKASTADPPSLVLTAELVCHAPDGSNASVWKLSGSVAVLRGRQDPAAIKLLLRPGTRQFFKKFVEDVRDARSKVKLN